MMVEVSLDMKKSPRIRDPIRARRCERAFPVVKASVFDGGTPVPLEGYDVEAVCDGKAVEVSDVQGNAVTFALPKGCEVFVSVSGEGFRASTDAVRIEVVG